MTRKSRSTLDLKTPAVSRFEWVRVSAGRKNPGGISIASEIGIKLRRNSRRYLMLCEIGTDVGTEIPSGISTSMVRPLTEEGTGMSRRPSKRPRRGAEGWKEGLGPGRASMEIFDVMGADECVEITAVPDPTDPPRFHRHDGCQRLRGYQSRDRW